MGAVRHRFTVGEYRKMGEAGIFSEDDRVELIDGEVVKMAAIGDRHVESVMRLTRLLSRLVILEAPEAHDDGEEGVTFFVSPQNPLTLGEHFEPEPDLVLLRRREGRAGVPIAEEVLLVVEVAYTSLVYDRETKLPLYAEAGIPRRGLWT
jgi:Uma2 family endonuclease